MLVENTRLLGQRQRTAITHSTAGSLSFVLPSLPFPQILWQWLEAGQGDAAPTAEEPQSFMRGLLANLSKLCLEREITFLYHSGNKSTLGFQSNESTLRLLCLFLSPLPYKHHWKHGLEQKLPQDVQKRKKPISCRREVSKTRLLRWQLLPLFPMWNTDSYFWRKTNVKTSPSAQMSRQTINTSIKFCPKTTLWDNILSLYLTSLQLKCQLKYDLFQVSVLFIFNYSMLCQSL